MRLNGDMLIHFLKTRSSSAVGSSKMLSFNADNLQINDVDSVRRESLMNIPSKKRENTVLSSLVKDNIMLPGMDITQADLSENYTEEDGMFVYESNKPEMSAIDDDFPWKLEKPPLKIVDDIQEIQPTEKKQSLKLDKR